MLKTILESFSVQNTADQDQIASQQLCFSGKLIICIAFFAPLVIFSAFSGFGFFSMLFFTSTLLIMSTAFILSLSKNKLFSEEKLPEKQEGFVGIYLSSESEARDETKKAQDGISMGNKESCNGHAESLTHKKTIFLTSQRDHGSLSEVEWAFQLRCSDGSISDEESLIEIALSSGQCQHKDNREDTKFIVNNFPKECMLQHFNDTEMEFFNEITDEDNLIEIDIHMGSVKCPKFDIEA